MDKAFSLNFALEFTTYFEGEMEVAFDQGVTFEGVLAANFVGVLTANFVGVFFSAFLFVGDFDFIDYTGDDTWALLGEMDFFGLL